MSETISEDGGTVSVTVSLKQAVAVLVAVDVVVLSGSATQGKGLITALTIIANRLLWYDTLLQISMSLSLLVLSSLRTKTSHILWLSWMIVKLRGVKTSYSP